MLALIDSVAGTVRVCGGTFDNFCGPPAWSTGADLIAFGAPFEPKRLYVVCPERGVLEAVEFERNAPMPMLDCDSLSLR